MRQLYSAIILLVFLVTGCKEPSVPASKGGFWHQGIFFGTNLDQTAQQAIKDGCLTSRGRYTKNHTLFRQNKIYQEGWFLGRNKCRKLLKLDQNGDVLL